MVILPLLAREALKWLHRHNHCVYHNKHWWRAFSGINIDDLKRTCTPK